MLLGRREREDLTENTNRQKRRENRSRAFAVSLLVVDEDHFSVAGEGNQCVGVVSDHLLQFFHFALKSRSPTATPLLGKRSPSITVSHCNLAAQRLAFLHVSADSLRS